MELWKGARTKGRYTDLLKFEDVYVAYNFPLRSSVRFAFCSSGYNERMSDYGVTCYYEDAITILELLQEEDPRAAQLLGTPQDLESVRRELGLIE